MGSRAFGSNAFCTVIHDMMREDDVDAKKIAEAISTLPQFEAVIQGVIDSKKVPGYDPNQAGSDPAEAVIAGLSEALVKPEWES